MNKNYDENFQASLQLTDHGWGKSLKQDCVVSERRNEAHLKLSRGFHHYNQDCPILKKYQHKFKGSYTVQS